MCRFRLEFSGRAKLVQGMTFFSEPKTISFAESVWRQTLAPGTFKPVLFPGDLVDRFLQLYKLVENISLDNQEEFTVQVPQPSLRTIRESLLKLKTEKFKWKQNPCFALFSL